MCSSGNDEWKRTYAVLMSRTRFSKSRTALWLPCCLGRATPYGQSIGWQIGEWVNAWERVEARRSAQKRMVRTEARRNGYRMEAHRTSLENEGQRKAIGNYLLPSGAPMVSPGAPASRYGY